MIKYLPTIGLEIHAEISTKTKMFCDCPNDPDERHPNANTCPICLGHPGVLPTINKKAVEEIIRIGFALDGEINKNFRFDRKNYFYPDLPKGYQISQFDLPIVKGGIVDISDYLGEEKIVKIHRVHLEEDAGRLVHGTSFADQREPKRACLPAGRDQRGKFQRESASLVDFNRGGVPLMELVTEPDIHSAKQAVAFAKELQLLLRYLGVSDADMEKGQLRIEANISITRTNTDDILTNTENKIKSQCNSVLSPCKSVLGTKVEIKNLNSFLAAEQAIGYEIERQRKVLEKGGKVEQETRGWDDVKKITVLQRSKEQSRDYRYFPEPDLPPLTSGSFDLGALKLSIPELPKEKRERLRKEYNLDSSQVNKLIEEREAAEYFENAVSELEADQQKIISSEKIKLIYNYLTSDLKGLMKELDISFAELKISPENFADLIEMAAKKEISSRTAKDLLRKMAETGADPRQLVKEGGLTQVSDETELSPIIKKIIEENPGVVADYKKGKINALQFLVGKAMVELKGRGNPQVLRKLFEENF